MSCKCFLEIHLLHFLYVSWEILDGLRNSIHLRVHVDIWRLAAGLAYFFPQCAAASMCRKLILFLEHEISLVQTIVWKLEMKVTTKRLTEMFMRTQLIAEFHSLFFLLWANLYDQQNQDRKIFLSIYEFKLPRGKNIPAPKKLRQQKPIKSLGRIIFTLWLFFTLQQCFPTMGAFKHAIWTLGLTPPPPLKISLMGHTKPC